MPYFRKNPYPNYSPGKVSSFLENRKISSDVLAKIKNSFKKLSSELENASKDYDPEGDYSIYTGYCGHALLLFREYRMIESNQLLMKAIEIVDKALPVLKNQKISFLNGDSGPLALAAVLHKANNEHKVAEQLVTRLLEIDYNNPSHPDEILYGRAGYLFSLLFVQKYFKNVIPVQHIRKVTKSILRSGKKHAKRVKSVPPLYYTWHDKNYFGAAHGLAGILYMLLALYDLMNEEEMDDLIRPSLDWLLDQKCFSGNPKSSEGSNKDRLVQWCHGAPGFVYLYILAHKAYNDDKYLQAAIDYGDVVWERGILEKGYSICHGTSGNAYTFLALYKATKNEKHLYRAVCFADWCTTHPTNQSLEPDHPYSLFEGIAGVVHFLFDIQDPLNSCFPGYEI